MPKKPKEGENGEFQAAETEKVDSWEEDQNDRPYYYDDASGYEKYDPEDDEEDDDTDPETGLTIWTIGHSTRTLDEFLELLKGNDVQAVADVRTHPGSRKYPHFNADALSASLADAGIELVPIKELGGRRRPKPDSANTVWRNMSFRGYADHMETPEFGDGIRQLLELAAAKRTTLMCAEAVWWRCHRSMISDYLKASGVTVLHIMDAGTKIHPLTSAARIENGKLIYGPA